MQDSNLGKNKEEGFQGYSLCTLCWNHEELMEHLLIVFPFIVVSLGIAPRVLQLPRAPQLYLSTQGSYKLRGDSAMYTIDGIILMSPSTWTFGQ